MFDREAIIATTHLDSEGDKLTIDALHGLVDSINATYIPIWDEHDPRNPPIGRIVSAKVRERDDGEHEVVASLEFFDGSEAEHYHGDRELVREMRLENGEVKIVPDRSFRTPEDLEDIEEIAQLLGTRSTEAVKKAIDPISILQLTAAFMAGGIASGFLGKLGSDAADLFKDKVKGLMRRKNSRDSDRVFRLVIQVQKDGECLETDVFITNPTDKDIDSLLDHGLSELDQQVSRLMSKSTQLSKLTFEYKDGNLELKFGVRKDCVPVTLQSKDSE